MSPISDRAILIGHQVRLFYGDLLEWAVAFEKMDRRVAQTSINGANVSTVFLGLNHGFGGEPLWFETMVFGGLLDGEADRYATWDEAERGHAQMVERVRRTGTPRLPDAGPTFIYKRRRRNLHG